MVSVPKPTGLALLAGAVAGLATIAVSDLTAWILAPDAAPLTVLAASLARLLPTSATDLYAGSADVASHPATVMVTGLVVIAVCALGGVLELRRRYAGLIVFGGLAAVGLLATFVVVPSWFHTFLPALVGPVAGYVVLHALITALARHLALTADLIRPQTPQRLPTAPSGAWSTPTEIDLSRPVAVQRRTFLRTTGIVGGIAAAATVAGEALLAGTRQAAETRAQIRLPVPAQPGPTTPAGADLRIAGLSPYVTPTAEFYRIDTALHVPIVDPDTWLLKVTGLVEQEVTLTYRELLGRPLVEHLSTLTCKANPVGANRIAGNLVGNASWLGWPVRDLLAEARPDASADMVLAISQDGWSAGAPLSALVDPDRQALLAVGMNGQLLPPEHGFPVRLIVPGLYGDVSATKWLTELKVTTFAADQGYWTPLGWSPTGSIQIASRIDVPRPNTIDEGSVMVAGVAWAPHVGVDRVQLRVDDEDWEDTELGAVTGPDTWRQWSYSWSASPGPHRLTVRATDADGRVQTDEVTPPAPRGATGWHSIEVRVRRP